MVLSAASAPRVVLADQRVAPVPSSGWVVTRTPRTVASRDMTEEQPFEVVRRYDGFALRRYPSHVVAEVTVELPLYSR